MPFQKKISLVRSSRPLLFDTLEDAINKTISVRPLKVSTTAAHPYAAGLCYDMNLAAEYGSRVSGVEINSGLSSASAFEWNPIDLSAKYRAATNHYLAGGGDGYFDGVPEEDISESDVRGLPTHYWLFEEGGRPPQSNYTRCLRKGSAAFRDHCLHFDINLHVYKTHIHTGNAPPPLQISKILEC